MIIKELILDTKHLEEQLIFYHEVLGFELIKRSKTSASFRIGKSILTFDKKSKSTPYHFAFNIPFDKVNEGLIWLKRKVQIIAYQDKDIVDFVNWKAKAIYFYDEDQNIVEFIGRKAIKGKNSKRFTSKSIVNISEIGVGTNDIQNFYDQLLERKPIPVFDGDFDRFCALGNTNGLFIAVDILKKEWFPTGDKIHASGFSIKGDYNFEYREGKLKDLP